MSATARALLCLSVLCLGALDAAAQSQKKLPMPVQKELAEMMKMCSEVGGQSRKSPGLLTIADLNADGLADFVIDQGAFNCEGAASLFAGSGGSQMSAYVGTSDGQAVQAFSSGHFGVKVDMEPKPATLRLVVAGPLCGQKIKPGMSHAESKSCWRPVVWNPKSRKLEYAPLSQIRPVE